MARGLFDPVHGPAPDFGKGGKGRGKSDKTEPRSILTVHQLTTRVKKAIEEGVGEVWVEGEVSNVAQPASGHVYFTLKDDRAQLQAVMWKGIARRLGFKIRDGDELIVLGRVTVYEPRGQYQIVVDRAELAGLGALQRAFEELKAKLAKRGLFDESRKRPIPFLPRVIGIVTSPTGAAIHDMLRTIWSRRPGARVVLRPVRVQGESAAPEIAKAIAEMNSWGGCDVLIVGRGGGSLEDLWAFNEESVARAIARSRVPVISAVGHEVDMSISDLVADVRALTPTDAGMKVVPRIDELEYELATAATRLGLAARRRVASEREHVELLSRSYGLHAPAEALARERQRLDDLGMRFASTLDRRLSDARTRMAEFAGRLEGLSPLAVLARGYTVTSRVGDRGEFLRDAAELSEGDRILTRFARGQAESVVDRVRPSGDEPHPTE
ncbi:MAG: exodeoxyribonuclease VII large subunit [Planctomycetota bacterium]|jgi:exodeoxyribonuclease VII large subunit